MTLFIDPNPSGTHSVQVGSMHHEPLIKNLYSCFPGAIFSDIVYVLFSKVILYSEGFQLLNEPATKTSYPS